MTFYYGMCTIFLLAVPFLIAVIHIFLAAGLGGCCFVALLSWELEYGDLADKNIKYEPS